MTSLPLASAAEAAPVDAAALVEAAVEVDEELPPQAVMAAAVPRTAAHFRQLRRAIFMELFLDVLGESLVDTAKMLPFLFLAMH